MWRYTRTRIVVLRHMWFSSVGSRWGLVLRYLSVYNFEGSAKWFKVAYCRQNSSDLNPRGFANTITLLAECNLGLGHSWLAATAAASYQKWPQSGRVSRHPCNWHFQPALSASVGLRASVSLNEWTMHIILVYSEVLHGRCVRACVWCVHVTVCVCISVCVDTCGNTTISRHVLLKVCIAMYGYVLCMVRYVWLCMCVCKLAYVCMHLCACMCICVNIRTYLCTCMCPRMCINVYKCVCMMCMHDMFVWYV